MAETLDWARLSNLTQPHESGRQIQSDIAVSGDAMVDTYVSLSLLQNAQGASDTLNGGHGSNFG
jgi:hypothetical protein